MQEESENSNGFLEELKTQFQRDLDIRTTLDSKSIHMITMCSTVVTILISIGTFLVSKINANPDIENVYPLAFEIIFFVSLAILGIGIILATICISYLIKSYSLRKSKYPVGHDKFFENGKYLDDKAETFRTYPSDVFMKHIIREYLVSIKYNAEQISEKAGIVKEGQKYLIPCIISIAVLLGFILVTFGLNLIKLNF